MAIKTKVRTTLTPGKVIEVGAAELLDLERQGLIHSKPKPSKADKADKVEAPATTDDKADDSADDTREAAK